MLFKSNISLRSILLLFSILASILIPLLPPATPVFADSSHTWTTEADFEAGVLNDVDTSTSPGDVMLGIAVGTGNGSDGDWYIPADNIQIANYLDAPVTAQSDAGSNIVYVGTPPEPFQAGDEVLVIQMTGTGAGKWETAFIQSVGSGQLTLTTNLVHTYYATASSKSQLMVIPQTRDVTIEDDGLLICQNWDGSTGGVIFLRVNGTLTVEAGGRIDTTGASFGGGAGGNGSGGAGGSGGYAGGSSFGKPDGGDGGVWGTGGEGGYPGVSSDGLPGFYGGDGGQGGNAGYQGAGQAGAGPDGGVSDAGGTNGSSADMSLMQMGGGGGGGSSGKGGYGGGGGGGGGSNTCGGLSQPSAGYIGGSGGNPGQGGTGGLSGGVIVIFAKSIVAQQAGFLTANGRNGTAGAGGGNAGAGGKGGSGAKFCVVRCDDADCTMGGSGGGGGGGGGGYGGDGGNGGGGGSGGTVWLAAGAINMTGTGVTAVGGSGGGGGTGGGGGGGGSGGSGGETDMGGYAGSGAAGPNGPAGSTGSSGGNGSAGKIRMDYGTLSGSTNPSPVYSAGVYVADGTIASDVLDTGIADTPWGELDWLETLPASTDITFEVRASNTPFTKDNNTITWISVGGTSPVTTGLPSGRYTQWRATLTSTNSFNTPVLHEVTTEYTNAPDVETHYASSISTSSATLNGDLISLYPATNASVSFEWGTASGSYSWETTPQSMNAPGTFQANLYGLIPMTTYFYRAKATGTGWGTGYGAEKIFTTADPPVISTLAADSVSTSSADLNGCVNYLPDPDDFMTVYFLWGTDPSQLNNQTPDQYITSGYFNQTLHGLSAGTTYYFRAVGFDDTGSYWDDTMSFTTPSATPSVTTGDASAVTANSATLNGDLANLGTATTVNVSFQWGTQQGGPYPNSTPPQAMTARGSFSAGLTNLTANTTYYFRAIGNGGSHGTGYGAEMSFTTPKVPPSVNTSGATGITSSSANLNGNLTALGTAATINVSFQYGTTSGIYDRETDAQPLTAPEAFQANITSLTGNTTYYFRAKADGGVHGTSYGAEMSFTTSKVPPSVTTNDADNVTTNAATLKGTLHSLGTAPTVNVSFQYGTTSGMYSNETAPQSMAAPGDFQANLGSLTPDTTYYYRAKADGGIHGISYGTEHFFTTGKVPPSVTTNNASNLTTNSAALNGTLTDLGTATIVNVSFQWGTQQGGPYPNSTPPQAMTSTGAFQAGLTGLSPSTIYYYRAKADGGIHGTDYGDEKIFHTGMFPPYVETDPATGITASTATLNGNLRNRGSAPTVNVSFEYGTTQGGPYTISTPPQAMTAAGTFQANLSSLNPNTTYYYRAKGDGGQYGVNYGEEHRFTTSTLPPSVTTNAASGITADTATLNGNLDDLGTATTVNASFQYGTTSGGPYFYSTTPQAMAATGTFQTDISGLHGDTTYYFRAKADGGIYGTSYGAEQSLTTSMVPPSVTTDSANSVAATSATLNGFLDSMGTASTVNTWFMWGMTPGGPYPNTTPLQTMDSSGYFHADINDLMPLTTYYFVARADGGVHGTSQGDEMSFTTGATPPSVSTGAVNSITASSATLNGDLHSLGTAPTVNVLFQWGTTPGVYSDQTAPQAMNTPGDFTANLSSLLDNTTYYYRAMADGGAHGTSYGTEHSFTTSTLPPSVTTSAATDMTTDTAFLNGDLTALGTAATVNVSFIYGVTPGGPYPSSTPPQAMAAIGAFQTGLTCLTPFTTYYFKAKSDGGVYGTSYGAEMNFTTNHLPPVVGTGSAIDIMTNAAILNGNLYLLGSAPTVNVSFEWGTAPSVYSNETTPQAMTEPEAFQSRLTSLTPNTTYYYRAKGDGGVHGIGYGTEHAFTTSALPPSVTTDDASNITASSAMLNGTLDSPGTATTINVSFQYGTTHGGPYPSTTAPQALTVPGAFQANLSGLTAHTAYYFRAKADGGIFGTSYGAEMSFITSNIPPTVTTGNAGNIITTAARLNGNLVSLGSSNVADVSFQWGTTSGVYPDETTPQTMNTTGSFFADLTGLTRGTTYYFRANAVADGTTYGTEQSFVTAGASYGVETATGVGIAYFSSNAGDIQNLVAVAEGTLPTAGKPAGLLFPEGFFSFSIINIVPGSSVTITITLPQAVPVSTQYWLCQNGIWTDLTSLLGSNDGDTIITITKTDGGLGDADGLVNGTIVDPGGPGIPVGTAKKRYEGASTGELPVRRTPPVLKPMRVSISAQTVKANQPVTITAYMVNQGEIAGSSSVALTVNGYTEQTRIVNLAPGAVQPVTFTVSKAQPGEYSVNINGQRASFMVAGDVKPTQSSHQGLVMALATAVLVILSGLFIVVLRRRFQTK